MSRSPTTNLLVVCKGCTARLEAIAEGIEVNASAIALFKACQVDTISRSMAAILFLWQPLHVFSSHDRSTEPSS